MNKRWLVAAVALGTVGALLFWLRSSTEGEAGPGEPSAGEARRDPAGPAAPVAARAVVDALLSAPLPHPRGELTLQGVVRDAQGPVAGAVVVAVKAGAAPLAGLDCGCSDSCGMKLATCTCWHAAEQLRARLAEQRDALQPSARTTTDAQGAFTLAGLEAGPYTVWAQAGARGSAVRDGLAPGGAPAELALDLPASFRGKVLDREGRKPLAGAHLVLMLTHHPYVAETDSAADGSFALTNLPSGDYVLLADHPGFLPGHQSARGPVARLEVTLEKPQTLRGVVKRGAATAPGVEVTLEGDHRHEHTQSGPDGTFAFANLSTDSYRLQATAGREVAGASAMPEPKAPPVELLLAPGGEVGGQVVDDRRQPVPGAKVSLSSSSAQPAGRASHHRYSSGQEGSATTGPDGRFHLLCQVGQATLSVSAPGFQAGQDGPFPVEAERAAERRVTLVQAAPLRGVVLDARGQPVAEAQVSASAVRSAGRDEEDSEGRFGRATTGPDGTFSLDHLAPGRYQVRASHPRFLDAKAEAEAPGEALQLGLRDGLALRGRVLDEGGEPVAGAGVAALPASLLPGHHREEARPAAEDEPSAREASTDASGAFALEGLVAGHFTVVASEGGAGTGRHSALGQGRTVSREVEVRAGPAEELVLRLEAGLSLRGQVVDDRGQPVSGAMVEATLPRVAEMGSVSKMLERMPHSAESGEGGSFEVPGLKPGQYQLRATHPDYAFNGGSPPVTAQPGGEPVTLTLVHQGKVSGRVVGPDGAPLPEYSLNGRPVRDPAGAFEEPVRRDADLTLRFEAAGRAPAQRTVAAKAGQDQSLPDVVLGPGRSLRGKVIARATGAPVAGARVALDRRTLEYAGFQAGDPTDPSAVAGTATTGPEGTFTLEGAEAGAVEVFASHPDFGSAQATAPAGGAEVVIAFEPAGTVEGRCADAQGQPLSGEVSASKAGAVSRMGSGERASAKIEADGSYHLRGLSAGSYTVRLASYNAGPESGDLSLAPRPVELAAGATVKVDFVAAGGATLKVKVSTAGGSPALGSALLVPGVAAAPARFEDMREVMRRSARGGREGEGGWSFKGVSAGHYTLLFMTPQGQSMGVFAQGLDSDGKSDREVPITLPEQLPEMQMRN